MKSGKYKIFVTFLCVISFAKTQPYANDYPYQKYGFNVEGSRSDSDGTRFLKNNLRDRDDRLKHNLDTALTYNLDSNKNEQNLNQIKKGGSTDNLTHVQGENFETDKSHKRKHIKRYEKIILWVNKFPRLGLKNKKLNKIN